MSTIILTVEDEPTIRSILVAFLEDRDYTAIEACDGDEALDQFRSQRPDLVLCDLRMPGMDGLALLDRLNEHHVWLPTIILTGHGDIPMAVRAMKSGAVDFIEKPFNDELLLESIRNALNYDQQLRSAQSERAEIAARLAQLTPREHEVMEMVTDGRANKEIAHTLGVSAKTVEAHRARVMEKMEARSLAELVKMAVTANLNRKPDSGDDQP